MSTRTDLANMAFSHMGKGTLISNIDSDTSTEAKTARLFFDVALKRAQREFWWPFTTRIESAQLIDEDPNSEWAYSYKYPVKCLDFRRILSGARVESEDDSVEYRIIGDDTDGRIILTDQAEAEIEYTKFVENVAVMPADFLLAFPFLLGSLMAPRIAGAKQKSLAQALMAEFRMHAGEAMVNAASESRRERKPTNSFVGARR